MPGAWLLKDVGANGRTGELVLACSAGRLQGSALELREKGTFQSRNPGRGKGSPAPGSAFAVGTAGRLLVLGEMLAPWNDRGPPGAFSSSVKPPHPFPPSLLPALSCRVYNLCRKLVFGLVLAGLQAVRGPWWGSASPATVDPPHW